MYKNNKSFFTVSTIERFVIWMKMAVAIAVVALVVSCAGASTTDADDNTTPTPTSAAPGVATDIKVVAKSTVELEVSFTAGVRATSHKVKWKKPADAQYTTNAVTGTNHTITGLVADTEYEVIVIAENSAGETPSAAVTKKTLAVASQATPPGAPGTIAFGSVTATGFTATWAAPSDAGKKNDGSAYVAGDVTYAVTISPNEGSVSGTGLSRTFTGLSASTKYTVTVTPSNPDGGVGTASSPQDVTTKSAASQATSPGAPGAITFPNFTTTGFEAAWTAPSDFGKKTDGSAYVAGDITYAVTINPSNSGATMSGTGLSRTFAGLTEGTEYTVTVTPSNPDGGAGSVSSAKQTTKVAPPGAPTGVTVTAKAGSSTELDVSFTGGDRATSHTISWKASTEKLYRFPVTLTGTSYTITGLTPSTQYDVSIRAKNGGGSTPAAAVQGTTASATEASVNTKIANTQNLGSTNARGSYFANSASGANVEVTAGGTAVARDVKVLINTYLTTGLSDDEVNFVVANLGTKYKFQIGVGDNRDSNANLISRFTIVNNWDGTGTGAETANLALTPEITGETYTHKMTFVRATKKITITDVHGGENNRYGSIRYFKVLPVTP